MQTVWYGPRWKYCCTQEILYYNICLADHHICRDNLHVQSYMFPLFCNDPCIVQLQYNPFLFHITLHMSICLLQKDLGKKENLTPNQFPQGNSIDYRNNWVWSILISYNFKLWIRWGTLWSNALMIYIQGFL